MNKGKIKKLEKNKNKIKFKKAQRKNKEILKCRLLKVMLFQILINLKMIIKCFL